VSMFIGKTTIFIMRENKSAKRLKLSAGQTEFKYKKGKYYLQDRGCFLRNKKVYAFYFEGLPNPISFDNIANEEIDPDNENEQAELKIDSSVIKDMTERDFLRALTQNEIQPMEMIFMMLGAVSCIMSGACLFFVFQLSQAV